MFSMLLQVKFCLMTIYGVSRATSDWKHWLQAFEEAYDDSRQSAITKVINFFQAFVVIVDTVLENPIFC